MLIDLRNPQDKGYSIQISQKYWFLELLYTFFDFSFHFVLVLDKYSISQDCCSLAPTLANRGTGLEDFV